MDSQQKKLLAVVGGLSAVVGALIATATFMTFNRKSVSAFAFPSTCPPPPVPSCPTTAASSPSPAVSVEADADAAVHDSRPFRAVFIVGGAPQRQSELADLLVSNFGYVKVDAVEQPKGQGSKVLLDTFASHAASAADKRGKFVVTGYMQDKEHMHEFTRDMSSSVSVDMAIVLDGGRTNITTLLMMRSFKGPCKYISDAFTAAEMFAAVKQDLMTKVLFVLGGPGSGKGTQCSLLTTRLPHAVAHFSAGDLLREERAQNGPSAGLIEDCIREGKIVPAQITIALLQRAILSTCSRLVLIDGFPRNAENHEAWREMMTDSCHVCGVLFLDCSEEEMQARLLERGKASGRIDDNVDAIMKRFRTYRDETMPIVQEYTTLKRCRRVPSGRPVEEVMRTCHH